METDETKTESLSKKGDPKKIAIAVLTVVAVFLIAALLGVLQRKSSDEEQKQTEAETTTEANEESDAMDNASVVSEDTASADVTSSEDILSEAATASETEEEKYPDLYIVKYSFNKDPKMGEEFTVNIKIGNKGKADAKSFHWEWDAAAGSKDCTGKVDSLSVGETEKVSCEFTYQGWSTYATKASVDSKAEIQESDESNNEATEQVIPIHEEAKADLYISEYKFNHPPRMGEAFTVSVSIYNQGDKAADSFWWEWWPTKYDKACREKIDNLVAHGGKVVTCTYTYGGWSTYVTKAVVDADNDVSESEEGNNTYTEDVVPIH
jgi:subtilase family serine protease